MSKHETAPDQKMTPPVLLVAKYLRANPLPEEQALWECLRAHRLNGWKFRRKHIINDFIVDFYCPRADLVVEIDDPDCDTLDRQDYNRELEQLISRRGQRLLRFSYESIRVDLDRVLAEIQAACELSLSNEAE